MSNNFEITLRTKSAEQLMNMSKNRNLWSNDQIVMINNEIKHRGLEVFEEPEPWNEEEMNQLNTVSPQTDFEQDMVLILEHEQNEKSSFGIRLAAQIVSSSALIVVFLIGMFIGIENYILITLSVMCAFVSLGLSIGKKFLASVIVGGISLLLVVGILVLFIEQSL